MDLPYQKSLVKGEKVQAELPVKVPKQSPKKVSFPSKVSPKKTELDFFGVETSDRPHLESFDELKKYFRNDSDMSYYDGIIKNPEYHAEHKCVKAKIVLMSPDTYFEEAAKNRGNTLENELRGVFPPHVEKLEKWVKEGNKFPILVIDKLHHEQEGRHRAMVAKKLGLSEIPVMIVEPTETCDLKKIK